MLSIIFTFHLSVTPMLKSYLAPFVLASCLTFSSIALADDAATADNAATNDWTPIEENAPSDASTPLPAETPLAQPDEDPNWHSGFMLSANVGAHVGGIFFIVGTQTYGGINAGIELGYHWRYFGIFVEQKILGNWVEETDTIFDGNNKEDKNDYRAFQGAMGGTNLLLKFFIPIADTVVIDLGIGAGVNYSRYTDSETNEKVWQPYPGARFEFALSWLLGKHLMLGFKVDITYLILIAAIEPSFTVGYNF